MSVDQSLDQTFKFWTILLAEGVEAAAGMIIALAALQAFLKSFKPLLKANLSEPSTELVRLTLSRWLALALEFTLAADILRTTVAPTWNEIGQLAAIIVLRTALNFFLQREIEQSEHKHVLKSNPERSKEKSPANRTA